MSTAHKSDEKQKPPLGGRCKAFVKKKVASMMYDTIEGETFSDAYKQARQKGLKTFVWIKNGQKYSTEYAGSPEEQMEKYGIIDDQLFNRSWWQERLSQNLDPFGYGNTAHRAWDAIVRNNSQQAKNRTSSRMDYFNVYMGKPQAHGTLGISKYEPANVTELNGKRLPSTRRHTIFTDKTLSKEIAQYWAIYAKHLLAEDNHRESRFYHEDMGHFKLSLGHDDLGDYICYHDSWDLEPGDFGKPFELYDRIYFDPKKIEECYDQQCKAACSVLRTCLRGSLIQVNCNPETQEQEFLSTDFYGNTEYGLFDARNRPLLERKTKINGDKEEVLFKDGKKVQRTVQNAEGTIMSKDEYSYDDEGHLQTHLYQDEDGMRSESYENNKQVYETYQSHDGTVNWRQDYYYSDAGVHVVDTDLAAETHNKNDFFYDTTGKKIGEIIRKHNKIVEGFGTEYEKAIQKELQGLEGAKRTRHSQYGNGKGIDDKLKKFAVQRDKDAQGIPIGKTNTKSKKQYGNGKGIDDKLGMSAAMTRKKQKHLTTASKKRGVHAA